MSSPDDPATDRNTISNADDTSFTPAPNEPPRERTPHDGTPKEQSPPPLPAVLLPTICPSCGTRLDGLALDDACPTCGVKIAHLAPIALAAQPAAHTLARNAGTMDANDALAMEAELDPQTCPRCGYDRLGLPRGKPCPECGKVPGVPDHFPAYDGPPEAPTRIEHSVSCASCGYDLRGLMSDGSCPECGNPIEQSLRPAYLRLSPPEALRRLRTVLLVIAWAVPTAWCAMTLGNVVGLLLTFARDRGSAAVFGQIVTLIATAVAAWGWWQLAEPDNKTINRLGARKGTLAASQRRRQLLVRAGVIATCVTALAWFVLEHASVPNWGMIARSLLWTSTAGMTAAGLSVVHVLVYRSDHHSLVKLARSAEAISLVMFILELVGLALSIGIVWYAGGSWPPCGAPARLLSLVVLILTIVVVRMLRGRVSLYLSWADAPPTP